MRLRSRLRRAVSYVLAAAVVATTVTAMSPSPATAVAKSAGRTPAAAKSAGTSAAAKPAATSLIVDNFDFPDYDPAEVTAIIDDWWPESLGLPDNSSLAQLLSGTWSQWNAQHPPSDWLPSQPTDLEDATYGVTSDGRTGSILNLTVPRTVSGGTPGALGLDPVLANLLAQFAGATAAVGAFAICGAYLLGIPTNDSGWKPEFGAARPWTHGVCNGIVTAAWGAFATVVGTYETAGDAPSSPFPYQPIIGVMLGGGTTGFGIAYSAPIVKVMQYAWTGLGIWLVRNQTPLPGGLLDFLTPYLTPDQANRLLEIVDGLSGEVVQQMTNPIAAARLMGLWTPVASGFVGNVPTGAAVAAGSGDCLDAYGSNGGNEPAAPPALPGHIVAINTCNGNPAQVFTFWPNGVIEAWGMCMDNPDGSIVVNLQVCDLGYSQLWYENGLGEIVNGATGKCLDDPEGNTAPGTQLVVDSCNAGADQLWAPPNGSDAVTGFGDILSAQNPASPQYCLTTPGAHPSPVGTKVITVATTAVCGSWAVGANGTIMANGTNALCMDSNGPGTTAPGGGPAYFVVLNGCNGSQTQIWNVVSTYLGPTLQNGDGLCLNTPSGTSDNLVSMIVAHCANPPYAGELWTLPGFSTAPPPSGSSVCDIYGSHGTPCVGAYAMDRALYQGYNGPLYQVKRDSDGATRDVGLLSQGGSVNASEQDSFCAGTVCTITEIYDQSPKGNNLTIEVGPAGSPAPGPDRGALADALPITIGGTKAYGLDIEQGTGYRDNATGGVATGAQPEGEYMVASGTHVNSGCCFDFGNVEKSGTDTGKGHMDAVNLTTFCGDYSKPCTGNGPWVEDDLEDGQWLGNGPNPSDTGDSTPFVTAVAKNDGTNVLELRGGDSTSGGLTTWYNGALPPLYSPMKKEGAIVLGTGGDNSNWDVGSFFEGVLTSGFPSDTADAAVQANIVAAGYAGDTTPKSNPATSATASAAGPAVVHSAGATGAGASGYSSVFTVDSADGHLHETYLPSMGADWISQDLAKYGTPPVMPGTQPVALVHCGYTSVYTVDADSGDLQETYLPAIGGPWYTQDLSVNYGAPPTNVTPTGVEHYAGASGASQGCGYTSVYTRDRNGDLQETYLSNTGFPGDRWLSQDLSANYGAPPILAGTSPVAIVHCGFTSVYTSDNSNHHLQETYLPAIGGGWLTQDLSANYGAPPTQDTPTAVMHSAGASGATADCGYTSVYTVDEGYRHLQETYLPNAGFPGDRWLTQDLSANYGTPAVAPGTSPVALVHLNYTSVYTVDQASNQLQETYLPAIGGNWGTQSLSANYGAPVTDRTPMVLLHSDTGGNVDWASVFTVDEFSSHLQETYLSNVGFPGDRWYSQDLSAKYGAPAVAALKSVSQASWSVVHSGNTSAFTVDAANGHLQESYLNGIGKPWYTQDLSANYNSPAVAQNSTPVTLVHSGYTSAYYIAGNGDLQELYLPVLGGPWHSQSLSANYHTPQVAQGSSPTAVVHDGYTSVYTIDAASGHLQETYLPFMGASWSTQDLSANYHAPAAMVGTSPVAIVHDGYTSVFTVDVNGDVQETYLPFMGASWSTQDLSANYGVPPTKVSPTVAVHDGYTSVFSTDGNGDMQESYLPYMGSAWYSHDLTAQFGAPQDINVAPAALFHDGYTSVYYITGPDDHLVEASLPAVGDSWGHQDMSANFQTPGTVQSPSPLVHQDPDGNLNWTSVYTADAGDGHLRETYLPDQGFPGNSWISQDLNAYGTPPVRGLGSILYTPGSSKENMGYVRMTRLAYGGGALIGTFEHSTGTGSIGTYVMEKSTDNGATWTSTLALQTGDVNDFAPFLYELPQNMGGLPAGTLLLFGNTLDANYSHAAIREYLSRDHGATWVSVGVVQSASGGPGSGVWEPFVMTDSVGDLVMLFSDERQNATHSQFLGEIESLDGGITWSANPDGSTRFGPGEVPVVAGTIQADRPGMATVAHITGGNYVMSFELCGPAACDVYTKTSPDGAHWGSGPSDVGTRAATPDGLHLQVSPFITWIQTGGQAGTLYLTAHRAFNANGAYPAGQTLILTNTNGGIGPWSWMPAPPLPTTGADPVCNTDYSPDLQFAPPQYDGSTLLYSAAEAAGPYKCQEVSVPVPVQS